MRMWIFVLKVSEKPPLHLRRSVQKRRASATKVETRTTTPQTKVCPNIGTAVVKRKRPLNFPTEKHPPLNIHSKPNHE